VPPRQATPILHPNISSHETVGGKELLGERKSPSVELKIEMADTTRREHNHFGHECAQERRFPLMTYKSKAIAVCAPSMANLRLKGQ
jgi:hypothetical protein